MRLIDADALRKAIEHDAEAVGPGYGSGWHFIHTINDAPTIDAVQVVRCKECVYRPCKQMPYSYDHDYCSYGERNRDEID